MVTGGDASVFKRLCKRTIKCHEFANSNPIRSKDRSQRNRDWLCNKWRWLPSVAWRKQNTEQLWLACEIDRLIVKCLTYRHCQDYKGMNYTSCLGENQMVDVLESGRGNVGLNLFRQQLDWFSLQILSLLSNNSESHTLSQLGARDGLRILGPIRGVLPIGPNGVPAFDTLENSPFSDQKTRDGMLSYGYTLEQQGLTSKINCVYDTESPVRFWPLPDGTAFSLQYNGTCDGKADVLTDVQQFIIPASYNNLGFWACGSPSNGAQDPSYFIYLRGRQNYGKSIGNITCTISPIKPATFQVTYQSQSRIFSVKGSTSVSSATYPRLIEKTLVALGGIIAQSQNTQSNLVAESVITFGVKSFRLPPYVQDQRYLRLYEAMIQGILEYEVCLSCD